MKLYGQRFFDSIDGFSRASAAALVPKLYGLLQRPVAVVDVGCGRGWFARAFEEAGAVTVLGLDGHADGAVCSQYRQLDLSEPFPRSLGRFDVAVSLEVAEHLEPGVDRQFIAGLCDLAPTVVFSAAIPGQRGTGHVNCQPPDHWAGLFRDFGYHTSHAVRWIFWDDDRISWWYRQNLMVASLNPTDLPGLFTGTPADRPYYVIHPGLWEERR